MSTKAKFNAGALHYYDSASHERSLIALPVHFREDFLGKAIDTTNVWTALDTSAAGLTTPVLIANGPNGLVSLPLDNTSEAQLSGLYWGDVRTLVLNRGLIFEARFALHTLPTGSVIVCIGLMGNHNAAADTVAESIWFRFDGNGVMTVETDDTANETSKVATGVTVIADQYVVVRIDCSDIADIKFFVDGNRVAGTTTFDMSTVAGLVLQPIARISKGAATTVGEIYLDCVKVWQRRTA